MVDSYVHLHQHTHYSTLDGLSKVDEVVAAAKADGQPGLAITDHGNLSGGMEFYTECKKQGINPILGIEAYAAENTIADRPSRRKGLSDDDGGETTKGKAYYHQLLLAKDWSGYQNIMKLSTESFLNGFYYKPRMDLQMLSEHAEGVIGTTSCLGGVVLQRIMNGDKKGALAYASDVKDILGGENYFVELQDHGIPEQIQTNPQLISLADKLDLRVVSTNDTHYVKPGDHICHDALLCIQTKAKVSDDKRFRFSGQDFYLKSSRDMRMLFAEIPEAADSTLLINDMVNIEIPTDIAGIPEYPYPDAFDSSEDYLSFLVKKGVEKRYRGTDVSLDEAYSRVEYELGVINSMGFASYFLIHWDLVKEAHSRGILLGWARGSAGGCAVSYCLNITKVDPIANDLLFERFLNPSRISMPDIDIDFESGRRDEMIEYAKTKYGIENVAQIITFSYIRSRAAVRDSARVLGYSWDQGDEIVKVMPDRLFGRDIPLKVALGHDDSDPDGYAAGADLRKKVAENPWAKEIVGVAETVEGIIRSPGVHASAVVVSNVPLGEITPLQKQPNKAVTSQWEMNWLEGLGLLKMDLLGLVNLDTVSEALRTIKAATGDVIDIYDPNHKYDDKAVYKLLSEGRSIGVFQLESPNMRALLRRLAPRNIDDISAVVALYRPGPMSQNYHTLYADRRNGREPTVSIHECFDEILGDTYQIPVFQEQIMFMAQELAGFSLAEADNLRKAMGKKDKKLYESWRKPFVEGAEKTGNDPVFADELFTTLQEYASYAFNKSHSTGYSRLSYWTAYLKANYTGWYMAALMSRTTKLETLKPLLAEARRYGIEIKPPSVNFEGFQFTFNQDTNAIHFPLSSIKGVGENVTTLINEHGPYQNIYQFVESVKVNKASLTALAFSGAFDQLTEPISRMTVVENEEALLSYGKAEIKDDQNGVMSLFGSEVVRPELTYRNDLSEDEMREQEKEHIGIFLTSHPVEQFVSDTDFSFGEILEEGFLGNFTLTAYIDAVRTFRTKKSGKMMAVLDLEDHTESVEGVIFPTTYAQYGEVIEAGEVYEFDFKVSRKDDDTQFIVNAISKIESDEKD